MCSQSRFCSENRSFEPRLWGLGFSVWLGLLLLFNPARAEPILPYTTRTHGYSGWATTNRGDIRTIGMAGAMVGLADSEVGSFDNAAGLAMTLDKTSLQINRNAIQDGFVQSYPSTIYSTAIIGTLSEYPWGLGLASWSPQEENDFYLLENEAGQRVGLAVHVREYRFSASRMFAQNKLSLGVSLVIGKATESVYFPVSGYADSNDVWAFGAGVGGLYRFPHRILLGVNYQMPMNYQANVAEKTTPVLNNFYQVVKVPYRIGAGLGWIPNRIFRWAFGLYLIGSTSEIALLSDDKMPVGEKVTFQPKMGFSYLMAEYKEFKAEISAGTYYEVLRVNSAYGRLHGTVGLEMQAWIINIGWALDEARQYQNFIYSAGLDIGKTLEKLELIPKPYRNPPAGFLPNPFILSEEGLARTVADHWVQHGEDTNLFKVGEELPGRLKKKIEKTPEDLKNLGNEFIQTGESVYETGKDVIYETGKGVIDTGKDVIHTIEDVADPIIPKWGE